MNSCSSSIVISNEAELHALQQCSTWSGNVTFESYSVPVTNPSGVALLTLPNITTIEGSLEFSNVAAEGGQALEITAPKLTTIDGGLIFNGIGQLHWAPWNITSTPYLSFTDVIFANIEVSNFSVQGIVPQYAPSDFGLTFDNTSVSAITGSLNGPSSPVLTIINNANLNDVDLTGFSSANITLANNGQRMKAQFPDLSNATSLNVANTFKFTAGQLTSVGQAGFLNNGFQRLALSSLRSIGQAFNVSSNPALTDLDVMVVTSAGDLTFTNNSMLQNINLPNLTSADDVVISGPINNLVAPALTSATVTVSVVPPGRYQCDDPINLNSAMFSCMTVTTSTAYGSSTAYVSATPTSSAGSSASSSSGLSSDAKIGIGVGVGIGVPLILLACVLLYLASRRRRNRTPKSPGGASDYSEKDHSLPVGHSRAAGAVAGDPSGRNEEQSAASLLRNRSRAVSPVHAHEDAVGPGAATSGTAQEMDARSLPDIEGNEADDDVDRRSLDDIERSHQASLE